MHYYACPYCIPDPKAVLVETTMPEVDCKYNREDTCEDKHKCKEIFSVSKKFLKEKKKKIKDG